MYFQKMLKQCVALCGCVYCAVSQFFSSGILIFFLCLYRSDSSIGEFYIYREAAGIYLLIKFVKLYF